MAEGNGTGTPIPAAGEVTEVDLCNRALGRLGAASITALDGSDTSDEATQCALHYAETRDALLRRYPWRFACRWVDLVRDARADNGTATAAAAATLEDTDQAWDDTGNGEYEGYYVRITGGTGAGQIRPIASNTTDTLTVTGAWSTTPDTTSTYDIWENYPPDPWAYQFAVPSDFLRYVKSAPLHVRFEIDGAMLKSYESAMIIQYVRQETTVDNFDPLFVEALVAALAVVLCMPLLHDKTWSRNLMAEAEVALSKARLATRMDAETKPAGRTWLEARS